MKSKSYLPWKIVAVVVIIFLAILVACGIWMSKYNSTWREGSRLQAQEDLFIKNEVQTAVSMLQGLSDKVKAGELTMNQAQKMGADLLRGLRYDGGNGYFWADTKDGVNVVLYGDKTVEGKNRLENQANGIFYVKQIIAAGLQSGGGFSQYYFNKKGETELKAKRSYSLYFEPFNWVVGTGYYLEDLQTNGCKK